MKAKDEKNRAANKTINELQKMVKTGQRKKRKVAVIKMQKEGSEENHEKKHTTRWKEAKSNLEEGGKITQ